MVSFYVMVFKELRNRFSKDDSPNRIVFSEQQKRSRLHAKTLLPSIAKDQFCFGRDQV